MASLIKVTLKRSVSKCEPRTEGTLQGLGLRARGKSKILKDTAPIRGMILRVQHLLDVERFDGDDSLRTGARVSARKSPSKGARN
jgi:large subunit ribosomal protein L30